MSISAVPMIVSDPPPLLASIFRALPRNRLGFSSALESSPPVRVRPVPRSDRVVGPRQPGDRIENQHHVLALLHPATGPLQGQLRHLDVPLGGAVEAGGDHLAEAAHLHLGDFLGPLVHQQDQQHGVGIVLRDTLRHRLKHHGLSRLGRRDDQGALSLAEGTEEVDDPVGVVGLAEPPEIAVEGQLFVGMDRAEVAKIGAPARLGGGAAIHQIDPLERCRLPSAGGASGLAGQLVARCGAPAG